jgi:hypothetical protein
MKGFGNFMKQAQKMQEKIMEMQEELAAKEVEATVGGGMVRVVANGRQEIVAIKIEPAVVNPEELDMLEDLIVAGVNEALRKVQEVITQEMSKITGGIKIPGLF